jgi:hypothetical protein
MTARATPFEAERAARLARECRELDEVREDVRAGRVIAEGDVDTWLDGLVSGAPLPEFPELPRKAPSSFRAG